MKKLIIDRETWYRGQGGQESKLQRSSDGCRCCLGFYCLQIAGLTEEQIIDRSSPEFLDTDASKSPALVELLIFNTEDEDQFVDSSLCTDLITLNDQQIDGVAIMGVLVGEWDREEKIAQAFATIGVEVEFIN